MLAVRDVVAVRAATRVHVRMPVHGVPCQLPPGVYPVVNMACHVHVYYPVPRKGRDAGGSTATNMCNQADLDDAGAPCKGGHASSHEQEELAQRDRVPSAPRDTRYSRRVFAPL